MQSSKQLQRLGAKTHHSQKNFSESSVGVPPNPLHVYCMFIDVYCMHIAQAQHKLNYPLLANLAQCTCSWSISSEHKK